jgi:hypothetical protein
MNRKTVRARVAGVGALAFALCASTARGGHDTWTTSGAEPGLVYQVVIDPGVSNRLYLVDSVFGAYPFRSTDGGQNWSYVETLEELYDEGISVGCGGGNFCPDASLTRAQAAALLTHAFSLS